MTVVTLNANLDPSCYRMEEASGDLSLIETFMARRPSVDEREAAGKALRGKVLRASHAHYQPSAGRPDPVSILEKQNEGRVPKLVPVRYARMLASPFTFLRGSAAVMASDLSDTPVTGMHDSPDLAGFAEYCGLCGSALALAHAKSGDAGMIAGYCGTSAVLDEAIGRFAMAYSKQTEKDHAALEKARLAGRIRVAANVV